jgi:hypothetical protein
MSERKWILRLLAVTILAGIPFVKSGRVQAEPNLSDNTGTNTYSAPPNFDSGSGSGNGGTSGATFTQTSNQAGSISQEINQAIDNLAASEAAPKGPRHFTRKEAKECVNPAAEELNNTVEKARNFVNKVNTSQTNNPNSSAW